MSPISDDDWKWGFYLFTVIFFVIVTVNLPYKIRKKRINSILALTTYIIQIVIFFILGALLAFHSLTKKSNTVARAAFWGVSPY